MNKRNVSLFLLVACVITFIFYNNCQSNPNSSNSSSEEVDSSRDANSSTPSVSSSPTNSQSSSKTPKPTGSQAPTATATVDQGDTIIYDGGVHVHLIDIPSGSTFTYKDFTCKIETSSSKLISISLENGINITLVLDLVVPQFYISGGALCNDNNAVVDLPYSLQLGGGNPPSVMADYMFTLLFDPSSPSRVYIKKNLEDKACLSVK